MERNIPALTGLRFFAAFFVLMSHGLMLVMPTTGKMPTLYHYISTLAAEGMTLFFVLSGFVIHYNYSASIRKQPGLGLYNFFVSRFARLYPLFIVGFSIELLHRYGYSMLGKHFWGKIPYYLTLTHTWIYKTIGDNALTYQFGHIGSISWSVSTEWFFYLMYPLACFGLMKLTKLRSHFLAFLTLSIIGYSVVILMCMKLSEINQFGVDHFGPIADINHGFQDSFYRWLLYFSPYLRIGEFFAGCITAAIYMKLREKPVSETERSLGLKITLCSIAAIVILHVLAYSQNTFFDAVPYRGVYNRLTLCYGLAPFIAVVIFGCARYQLFSRVLTSHPILLGGEISYSLYLFHVTIFEAFSRDAAPVTTSTHWKVFFADGSRLGLAIIACLGLAYFFYNNVEVPCRRWIRKKYLIKSAPMPEKELAPSAA